MIIHLRRLSQQTNPIQKLRQLIPKPVDYNHTSVQLKTLLQANLHLGHETHKWDQNMLPFLYGQREGIHIINLEHTLVHLKRASRVVYEVAKAGGNIVFVGTKPSLHKLVVDVATESNAYFVLHWIGGLFTNKERVLRRSVGYDPDKVSQSLSSQSLSQLGDEDKQELKKLMDKQPFVHKPDLLILLDYPNTKWAVHEANYAQVPIIAICDTDCDPCRVQYPIPANDDSYTGVELITRVLGKSCQDGALALKKSLTNTKVNASRVSEEVQDESY